jgi:hypothetical protein
VHTCRASANPLAGVAAQEVRIEGANAWRHLRPGQFRADLVQRQIARVMLNSMAGLLDERV